MRGERVEFYVGGEEVVGGHGSVLGEGGVLRAVGDEEGGVPGEAEAGHDLFNHVGRIDGEDGEVVSGGVGHVCWELEGEMFLGGGVW